MPEYFYILNKLQTDRHTNIHTSTNTCMSISKAEPPKGINKAFYRTIYANEKGKPFSTTLSIFKVQVEKNTSSKSENDK